MTKKNLFYLAAIGSSLLFLFFVTSLQIGRQAKKLCLEAQQKYQQNDCVLSLIAQLDDPNQGPKTRNHAIWALGQFGDSRALPVLQKYYTGDIPAREPLDETISQYELKKAISLANSGLNITAWTWRWGIK